MGGDFITIYDLSNGKGYQLYPERKEALVFDLKSASGPPSGISPDEFKRSIKETGKKKEIGGMSCSEYKLDRLESASDPRYGIGTMMNISGKFCVSQTIPEGIEVASFVHEAMKRGYRVATSALSPTQSPIGSYFLDQQPNMLVVGSTIETRIRNTFPNMNPEPMATITDTWTTDEIKSDPIPDEDFQIPTDWKQTMQSNFRGTTFRCRVTGNPVSNVHPPNNGQSETGPRPSLNAFRVRHKAHPFATGTPGQL